MSITMTEAAAKAVEEYKQAAKAVEEYKQSANAGDEAFLRVRITAGGCSGHSYKLEMDKAYDETKDSKYTFHGVDVVVDKKSELYLEGATLNFIQTLEQSG